MINLYQKNLNLLNESALKIKVNLLFYYYHS